MKAIYLIGFMGAGKTTVSKKLGDKLSLPVYDTDTAIIKTAGKSINEIFADEGEASFRSIESTVLNSMPAEDAVIATGGGVILSEENQQIMKERGIIVFLYAGIGEILSRLEGDSTRPLLQKNKLEALNSLYGSRLGLYREAAHFEIDTTGKRAAQIADEIILRMKP